MRALLPQLDAAELSKKPEQILAGQPFVERKADGRSVKSIDRSAPGDMRAREDDDENLLGGVLASAGCPSIRKAHSYTSLRRDLGRDAPPPCRLQRQSERTRQGRGRRP
jgi:hypothetical protein